MKNYYELLEVDIHASSEIIDKAFKVLAKKYHPDTQEADKKEWAEEQFKLINEAYEVLSDKEKRESYTKELEFDKNSQLEALLLKNADLEIQIENLQEELFTLRNASYNTNTTTPNNDNPSHQSDASIAQDYAQRFNNYVHYYQNAQPQQTSQDQTNYYESYYHPIKSKLKSLLAFFTTIGVIILAGFLLWKIPFTHDMLVGFYENNPIIHSIIDLIFMR